MRSLAAFLDGERADVAALAEIESGDALALATRLNLGWAHRGNQALLWNQRFAAAHADDSQRGILLVDGACGGEPLLLALARFTRDRARVTQLRALRSAIRQASGGVVLFCVRPPHGRVGFGDLGMRLVQTPGDELAIYSSSAGLLVER